MSVREHIESGRSAFRRKKFVDAERAFLRAVKEAESLAVEDERLAESLTELAAVYEIQENFAQALVLFERALDVMEKTYGTEHNMVWPELNNLARIYQKMGDHALAEPLFQRALAIIEELFADGLRNVFDDTLDPQDPRVRNQHVRHVATSLENLASLYREQGRYVEAKPLEERALSIRNRITAGHYSASKREQSDN